MPSPFRLGLFFVRSPIIRLVRPPDLSRFRPIFPKNRRICETVCEARPLRPSAPVMCPDGPGSDRPMLFRGRASGGRYSPPSPHQGMMPITFSNCSACSYKTFTKQVSSEQFSLAISFIWNRWSANRKRNRRHRKPLLIQTVIGQEIQGVFASLLNICYVASNIVPLDLIHILYLSRFHTPTLKKTQSLLIALHRFRPQLFALAIDHELIYLPVEGQIGHKIAPFHRYFVTQLI